MRLSAAALVVPVLAAVLAGCRDAPAATARPVGYTLATSDLAGLRAHLDARPSKLRVVNFWATWCVPCRREFPDLVRTAAAFDTSDVTLTFASVDFPHLQDSVRTFLTRHGAQGPAYLVQMPTNPASTTTFEPEWLGQLPATFVYDATGRCRFASLGAVTEQALTDTLRALLAEPS